MIFLSLLVTCKIFKINREIVKKDGNVTLLLCSPESIHRGMPLFSAPAIPQLNFCGASINIYWTQQTL